MPNHGERYLGILLHPVSGNWLSGGTISSLGGHDQYFQVAIILGAQVEKLFFPWTRVGNTWRQIFASEAVAGWEEWLMQWKASIIHFLSLDHLLFVACRFLEGIPFQIGEIPTLRLMELHYCSKSAEISAKGIGEQVEGLQVFTRTQIFNTIFILNLHNCTYHYVWCIAILCTSKLVFFPISTSHFSWNTSYCSYRLLISDCFYDELYSQQ